MYKPRIGRFVDRHIHVEKKKRTAPLNFPAKNYDTSTLFIANENPTQTSSWRAHMIHVLVCTRRKVPAQPPTTAVRVPCGGAPESPRICQSLPRPPRSRASEAWWKSRRSESECPRLPRNAFRPRRLPQARAVVCTHEAKSTRARAQRTGANTWRLGTTLIDNVRGPRSSLTLPRLFSRVLVSKPRTSRPQGMGFAGAGENLPLNRTAACIELLHNRTNAHTQDSRVYLNY